MIEFIIKSTLSLAILYLLYFFLLRNMKAFQFNRFFLLFVVFFSIAIPFLHINTSVHLPINQTIQQTSASMGNIQLQETFIDNQNIDILNVQNILLFLYLLVFTILLVRFVLNLYKLSRTIKSSERVLSTKPIILLASEKSLPYSFLNYIIVNKDDYETGNIENGLIIHEQTHCQQYHSVDILLIEIAKLVLWFNPVLWILKKEIQLVHEYIADSKVLQNQNVKTYQNVLLNLVFRNNSTYLASNFNYSLTKKRLLMMTKNNSLVKSMARKIAIVPLVFILTISLCFSQKEKKSEANKITDNIEWMKPFLTKHGFQLDKTEFNVLYKSKKVINDSYFDVKVAFNQADTAVYIVESPEAIINKERLSFKFKNGKDFTYFKNGDYAEGTFDLVEINN